MLPPEETRPDYEAELGVVFIQTFTRATLETARSKVGAYCAFHDVSGRQYQLETPLRQFVLGKSFDTFGPMGPLVRADGVDLNALDVQRHGVRRGRCRARTRRTSSSTSSS